jgi:hypothetical protein
MQAKNGIRSKSRIPVLQNAEVLSEGRRYQGNIENISESGINILVPAEECITAFIPGTVLDVIFKPSGKEIIIQYEIKWVRIDKNPSHGITYVLAMEAARQTPELKEYLKTLRNKS